MRGNPEPIRPQGIVAVIQRGGRYLLIRRAPGIRAAGWWCFVGGAIEPGESQPQALVREVAEEVGLVAEPVAKVWECPSLTGEWLLHCWSVRLRGGELRPNPAEVAEARWLTPAQIASLPGVMPGVLGYLRARNIL